MCVCVCVCVCVVEWGSTRRKNWEAKRVVWKLFQCPGTIRSVLEPLEWERGKGKHSVIWPECSRNASVSILISNDAKALGKKKRVVYRNPILQTKN